MEILKAIIEIIKNPEFVIGAASSFFGAFFAFLFGIAAYKFTKLRERFVLHRNAVVEIEYLLNEHSNAIGRSNYLIENSIDILRRRNLTYNRLSQFRIPEDLELRLADLEVINPYFDYKESVSRLNSDFGTINRALDTFQEIQIGGTQHLSPENHQGLIEQLELLQKILDSFVEDNKNLLAFDRVYLKKLNDWRKKRLNIYKLDGYKLTAEELDAELRKLEREVEKTIKESRDKTEKILSK